MAQTKYLFSGANLALMDIPLIPLVNTGKFRCKTYLLYALKNQLSFVITCQNLNIWITLEYIISD